MIDRRRFLRNLGLGLGWVGAGGLGHRALAGLGEAPRRVILLSHCHGWPYETWKMRPEGLGETTRWDLDLTTLDDAEWSGPLAPLRAHRDRLLLLDGLSLATAELDMDGNRHDTGWVHAWTGDQADFSGPDTRSRSASLDQLIAQAIARPDRLPSLELSVDATAEGGRPMSYAASGGRLPVANTPLLAWNRLFGLTANADPLVLRQQAALDFAYEEHRALLTRLGYAARTRLEDHFALIKQLGDRIAGLANLTCQTPLAPADGLSSFDETFDTFSELIGTAFACDITRVVTLSLGEMPTADFGWDHITDDVHKGLAHEIYNAPLYLDAMTDYITRHSGQVARLVDLLSSLPDVDGRSIMDNTLIVWGSELCDGWHGYQHYCPILIGGDWHFRTGRYLYWPHETPIQVLVPSSVDPEGYSVTCGLPHQHLLVSTAQAMGVDTQQVGLDHVQGQTGQRVDCTGPLAELTE